MRAVKLQKIMTDAVIKACSIRTRWPSDDVAGSTLTAEAVPVVDEAKKGSNMETALLNVLVLRNIFRNLNDEDLLSCGKVNSYWNSIARSFFIWPYDVDLIDSSATKVTIRTAAADVYNHVCSQEETFQIAYNLLEEASEAQAIAINLSIKQHGDWRNDNISQFVSQLGTFVVSLCAGANMTAREFCRKIVQDFPNLQSLDLSRTYISPETNDLNGHLPQNQLMHLRKIHLRGCNWNYMSLVAILELAPGLAEIHNFPVLLVRSLVITGKAGLVKSLEYPEKKDSHWNSNGENFHSALKSLADLDLNLESFSFQTPDMWLDDYLYGPAMTRSVLKILRSSHASLTSLTMYQSESFRFQAIPPMTSLKKIRFIFSYKFQDQKYFQPDTVLQRRFPNVAEVEICAPIDQYSFYANYFPKSLFSAWGSKIQRLTVCSANMGNLNLMQKIFPSIISLEFCVGEGRNGLRNCLSAVADLWPKMEQLTIKVHTYNEVQDWGRCSLDSALTGLSDDILTQLRDPASRELFTQEELESFRKASTLRRLPNLQRLVFDLSDNFDYDYMEKLSSLTPVSREFGFGFIPNMKLILHTNQNDKHLKDLKHTLGPLVQIETDTYEFSKMKMSRISRSPSV